MEPEDSIPYSQEPSTSPYPEPYQCNLHHPIPVQDIHNKILYAYLTSICAIYIPISFYFFW
jgi:hypothetical protein